MISITLFGEEPPVLMRMARLGIASASASNAITASFALPFSGIAVTRNFRASPSHPAIRFLDEPGTTLILNMAMVTVLSLYPARPVFFRQ